jgi:hypothetical protein
MPNNGPASSSVPRNSARDIQPSRGVTMIASIFLHYVEARCLAAPHFDSKTTPRLTLTPW